MHVYHKKETTPYVCIVNRTNVYNEYDNGTLSSYIIFFLLKRLKVYMYTRAPKSNYVSHYPLCRVIDRLL